MLASVPGKVFLLGEYAVLAGAPALVAAVPPRFTLSSKAIDSSIPAQFHPQSPVGRWRSSRLDPGAPYPAWFWSDPALGAGGFGASTAQLILADALVQRSSWHELWRTYRSLHQDSLGSPPSGADLVTQTLGGVIEFQLPEQEDASPRADQRQDGLASIHLAVIQASQQLGRKTATHLHLKEVSRSQREIWRERFEPSISAGIQAFARGDRLAFSAALHAAAEGFAREGLEIEAAARDREALVRLPGVLAVKGSGAMQSDALIAVIEPTRFDPEEFERVLIERGLRLWCSRLSATSGLEVSE